MSLRLRSLSEQVYSTMTGLKKISSVGQLRFRPWKIGSIVKMASKTGFYPRNKLKTQNLQPTLSVSHKAVMWSSCSWSHGSPFWLSVQRLIGDNGPMRFCLWLKGVEACQRLRSGLSSSQLLASSSQQWVLLFRIQNKEHHESGSCAWLPRGFSSSKGIIFGIQGTKSLPVGGMFEQPQLNWCWERITSMTEDQPLAKISTIHQWSHW